MAHPVQTTAKRNGRRSLLDVLREDTVGGILLALATVLALLLANTPLRDFYADLQQTTVGPSAIHLDLSLAAWATEGLLAIFFFVVGLELKREFVLGELRRPADAALPIGAAIAGMVVPALVYLAVTRGTPGTASGWAVPTATDIAFALAVLAVLGRRLPAALRCFLLTLAVVDDLLAIVIIAIFYTASLNLWPLFATAALLAGYAWFQRRRVTSPLVYLPLAALAWFFLHESGIHATIAGVALGLLTRCRHDTGEHESPAERLEHRLRPLAAAIAVPLFAFFAAGVSVDLAALQGLAGDSAALGVALGLVVGKGVGILLGTYLMCRFVVGQLPGGMRWPDIGAVAVLCGIGFTVSLLISELGFADQPDRLELVKAGVLVGSLAATLLAAVLLRQRNAYYRRATPLSSTESAGHGH